MTLDELRAMATVDRGDGWHGWPEPYAAMSVTLEDAEFLYALVRLTAPSLVLEIGTGLGISTKYIGEALLANSRGSLQTIEDDPDIRIQARPLLDGLPIVPVPVSRTIADLAPSFVFVDSGYQRRHDDIGYWLGRGPLLVVHDANRDYPQLRDRGTFIPGCDGIWLGR